MLNEGPTKMCTPMNFRRLPNVDPDMMLKKEAIQKDIGEAACAILEAFAERDKTAKRHREEVDDAQKNYKKMKLILKGLGSTI